MYYLYHWNFDGTNSRVNARIKSQTDAHRTHQVTNGRTSNASSHKRTMSSDPAGAACTGRCWRETPNNERCWRETPNNQPWYWRATPNNNDTGERPPKTPPTRQRLQTFKTIIERRYSFITSNWRASIPLHRSRNRRSGIEAVRSARPPAHKESNSPGHRPPKNP